MILKSRVTILVKASPQPSKKHSETVCCAGLEENGTWRRLFPIRFRRLSGEKAFSRWDTVEFTYGRPKDDNRWESCRVHEESIYITGKISKKFEKSALIDRALVGSEKEAISKNFSLAVIRPRNVSLSWKRLSESEVTSARESFQAQAAQLSFLDEELAAYEPCPFKFQMHYEDDSGSHVKTCADWETAATYFNLRHKYEERKILDHLRQTYCEEYVKEGIVEYVKEGIVFALGNIKKRPQTWQLLGIFPVRPITQKDLF